MEGPSPSTHPGDRVMDRALTSIKGLFFFFFFQHIVCIFENNVHSFTFQVLI